MTVIPSGRSTSSIARRSAVEACFNKYPSEVSRSIPPVDGPFGRTFTFADPDGYHITLHDRV